MKNKWILCVLVVVLHIQVSKFSKFPMECRLMAINKLFMNVVIGLVSEIVITDKCAFYLKLMCIRTIQFCCLPFVSGFLFCADFLSSLRVQHKCIYN